MGRPGRYWAGAVMVVALVGCTTSSVSPTPASQSVKPQSSPTAASPALGGVPLPTPDRPSRAQLIAQAVADGRIDQVTGLIYRAESVFDLPGVPDEYATGVPGKDDDVFVEMALLMPTLSPADQARLKPFLARPTSPDSIFAAQPSAQIGGRALFEGQAPAPVRCAKWSDSGDLDARFKVWACADGDPDAAEIDIATIVVMLQSFWGDMVKDEPDGMGPPLADNFEANPIEFGGDGRIDFYALDLGQTIYRDGDNEIPAQADAAAQATFPYSATGAASGFVMLNRNRMGETEFKQDVIHEFFHVLQFAHTIRATRDHGIAHWFIEATATWAESFYDRADSAITNRRFTDQFQLMPMGLEAADPDHQYAAYMWPLFMEQEAKATSIFKAWQQIGALGAGDAAGVTAAINAQWPFKDNFHEFAVRNLDLGDVLASANVKRYRLLDINFPEGTLPLQTQQITLHPGDPWISEPGPAVPLEAEYYHFRFAPTAKEVTISIGNVSPADARDGDALVLVGSKWERRPVSDTLKFCRDDPADNISEVYLVLSDHSATQPLLGFVEGSARESCDQQLELVGDLTWDEQVAQDPALANGLAITHHASGSAHIHAIWDPATLWGIQNDSRFTLHYEISNCSPSNDSAGQLIPGNTGTNLTDGQGSVWLQGAPKQDIPIVLTMDESWMASCDYGTGPSDPVQTFTTFPFPGCNLNTWATALYDGSRDYVINCQPAPDLLGPGYIVSGSVSGRLSPLN